jgi:hypothetical protein
MPTFLTIERIEAALARPKPEPFDFAALAASDAAYLKDADECAKEGG